MMARGLDHIVHAVRDLDAAAALYRQLGFQVGACNRHAPNWGTQNRIVQLPGTFIELLSIADASGIAPHAPRSFAFGAFNRDFLARGEMPPGVTADDLHAMGLPLPKPAAGGPAQETGIARQQRTEPSAAAFSCDSPDE